ncbi:HAD family phosphatase [Romboutsia weinsteinii]|uniref:HAD family phosphatase n=1 Tax=Romboutsia weinsteinii TaxID=2020949 RepID=A0A371J8D7_9FIRM|nr:HAD family phosphatase [Romboutsia weinsteinii]RDY29004.1 HAD family phosphatase [Romboutsia weinsteinii]
MLKAVIFDMDGVIVNTEPIYYKVIKELLNEMGHDIDYKEYEKLIGTTNEYTWDSLKKKFFITRDTYELIDEMMLLKEVIIKRDGYQIIDGIKELILDLKSNNIKLAVASSSPISDILDVTISTEIHKYFDKLITGESVPKSKPFPDVFLKAAKELNVEPEECIVIEDSKSGVSAAKSANMKCIGFKNIDSGNQDLNRADSLVESIKDLNYEFLKNVYLR